MQTYANWYRDQQGNAISGAQVTVFVANSSTLATIYEPSASGSALLTKSNPFTTDANGYYQFAAANGNYSIQLAGNSSSTTVIPYINLFDYGTTSTGGNGAAGAATQVQYNVGSGIFGASANLTFASNQLTVGGTGTPNSFSSMKYFAYDTVNGVLQTNIQNKSAGASASADVVASADVSSDTTNFVNMGINSSGWSDATWTLNGANDAYFYGTGNVAVGTSGAAKQIVFFVGGTLAANIVSTVTSTTWTIPAAVQLIATGGIRYNQGGAGAVNRDLAGKLALELVSIYDFGGAGDDSTDNTAALNAAATYCATNSRAGIYFPKGAYRFLSKPNDFLSGIRLIGDSNATTYFKRHYTPGSATEGFLTWNPNGSYQGSGGIENIGLLASNAANGGALIKLVATATTRPGFMRFNGIKVGSNAAETVNYNVYIDGSAFTTAGSNGVRDINFSDCWFFNATTHAVFINNGVHVEFTNCLINTGNGSIADFFVTGGGTPNQTNSSLVLMSSCEAGALTCDNCDQVAYHGIPGTVTLAATATNCVVAGYTASVTNSSATSVVYNALSASAGAAFTFNNALTVTGNGTFSGTSNSFGGSAVASPQVLINGTGATQKSLFWQTAGSNRWQWYVSTAEGGADSGSNIALACYTDAAAFIDNPIQINRISAGTITLGGTTNRPVLSNGDLKVNTAGKGLFVKEGSNAKMGTATLVAGASTVSTTAVSATSRIFVTSNADGGTPGWLRVSARVAGTSFTITSSSGTDTSTVAWIIVDPA